MAGGRESGDAAYRAMVDKFTADKRARVIPTYGMRRKVIPLDVALVEQEFKLPGDGIYCDINSTGIALVKLNSPSEDPFPLLALQGFRNLPYDGFYVTAPAQAGLFLNLWYGYGLDIISPTSAIATVGSITNPVNVKGPRVLSGAPVAADLPVLTRDVGRFVGSTYASATALTAAQAQVVFLAAANTNGAIIYDRFAATASAAAQQQIGLLAKNGTPTTELDGLVLYEVITGVANLFTAGPWVSSARFVPAGLGLYWFSNALETFGRRYLDYTLL